MAEKVTAGKNNLRFTEEIENIYKNSYNCKCAEGSIHRQHDLIRIEFDRIKAIKMIEVLSRQLSELRGKPEINIQIEDFIKEIS